MRAFKIILAGFSLAFSFEDVYYILKSTNSYFRVQFKAKTELESQDQTPIPYMVERPNVRVCCDHLST